MRQALRCRAKSKRSALACQSPAVRGYPVCGMHGAGGGAPLGNKNALKRGLYSAEAIEMRRARAAGRVGLLGEQPHGPCIARPL